MQSKKLFIPEITYIPSVSIIGLLLNQYKEFEGYDICVTQEGGIQRGVQFDEPSILRKIESNESIINKMEELVSKKDFSSEEIFNNYTYSMNGFKVLVDHENKKIVIVDGQQRLSIEVVTYMYLLLKTYINNDSETFSFFRDSYGIFKEEKGFHFFDFNKVNLNIFTPYKIEIKKEDEFGIPSTVEISDFNYAYRVFNKAFLKFQANGGGTFEEFINILKSSYETKSIYVKYLVFVFNLLEDFAFDTFDLANALHRKKVVFEETNPYHTVPEEMIVANYIKAPMKASTMTFSVLNGYFENNQKELETLSFLHSNMIEYFAKRDALKKKTDPDSKIDFLFQVISPKYTDKFVSKNLGKRVNIYTFFEEYITNANKAKEVVKDLHDFFELFKILDEFKKKGQFTEDHRDFLNLPRFKSIEKDTDRFSLMRFENDLHIFSTVYNIKEKTDFAVLSFLFLLKENKVKYTLLKETLDLFNAKFTCLKGKGINNLKELEFLYPIIFNSFINEGECAIKAFNNRKLRYDVTSFFTVRSIDFKLAYQSMIEGEWKGSKNLNRALCYWSKVSFGSRILDSELNPVSSELFKEFDKGIQVSEKNIIKAKFNNELEYEHVEAKTNKKVAKSTKSYEKIQNIYPLGNTAIQKEINKLISNDPISKKAISYTEYSDKIYYNPVCSVKRVGSVYIEELYKKVSEQRILDLIVYFRNVLVDYDKKTIDLSLNEFFYDYKETSAKQD